MSVETVPEKKPGAKDLFNLVKKSPALMITAIGGVLLVGYVLIKKSGSATVPSVPVVPDATNLAATTTPGGYYTPQSSYVEPVVVTVPGSTPAQSGGTTSTGGSTSTATIPSTNLQDDIVRTRYGNPTVKSYDTNHPQGVPIRSQAAATTTDTIGYAAYGSKIQITGPAVSGTSNLGGTSGTNYWYPVAGGGFVSAFDVQSSFPAATTKATVPSNS